MFDRPKPWMLLGAFVLAALAFWLWTLPASAQCGSSVSNCKQCHEVKKEASVNTKGAWHTAHAFGDFCEFCHAGNVKGKDKASAHTGLSAPLADIKASCQSCHPNDYTDRAQKYATALGTTIGSGAPTGGAPATGAAGGNETCGPAAPASGTLIDINKIYAGLDPSAPNNTGNYILLALIVATLGTAGALGWHYEKPLPRILSLWQRGLAALVPAANTAEPGLAARIELARLQPLLARCDAETLRALEQMLSDPRNGPRVLQALGRMDLRALAALGEGDRQALAALTSLAREMH